jgi:hypothetical protein
MGVALWEIELLLSHPKLAGRRLRVLDIGAQNLYHATSGEIVSFLERHGPGYHPDDLAAYADMLAAGARIDAAGGIQGAWLGEILSRVGADYLAYDIFEADRTAIFDLNRDAVPQEARGSFDLVLNCGTTEHVLNQFNAFRVIHDACRTGGVMYHNLPMTGYLDHGYFCYNPRLFFELAAANRYTVHTLGFGGPGGGESVVEKFVRQYQQSTTIHNAATVETRWGEARVPTGGLAVVLEKTREREFRASLETSTTAGAVSAQIGADYPRGFSLRRLLGGAWRGARPVAAPRTSDALPPNTLRAAALDGLAIDAATDGAEAEIARIADPERRKAAALAAYRSALAKGGAAAFAPALERLALEAALAQDPQRGPLRARLGAVLTHLTRAMALRGR